MKRKLFFTIAALFAVFTLMAQPCGPPTPPGVNCPTITDARDLIYQAEETLVGYKIATNPSNETGSTLTAEVLRTSVNVTSYQLTQGLPACWSTNFQLTADLSNQQNGLMYIKFSVTKSGCPVEEQTIRFVITPNL